MLWVNYVTMGQVTELGYTMARGRFPLPRAYINQGLSKVKA